MRSFKDAKGRKWRIEINTGAIKRIRELTGFELLSLVGDQQAMLDLRDNPVLLVDVVCALCRPQIETYGSWWRKLFGNVFGLTDEDFGLAMRGDALETAWTEILGGLCDFFPEGRRLLMAAAMLQAELAITLDRQTKRSLLGIVPPSSCGATSSAWRALRRWLPGNTPTANCR